MRQLIEQSILREEITYRGGGVEIDLTDLGFEGEKMTAYQNYLGGGMLGRINNDCTIKDWQSSERLQEISISLSQYYHEQTNDLHDEWSQSDFDQLQERPSSAY